MISDKKKNEDDSGHFSFKGQFPLQLSGGAGSQAIDHPSSRPPEGGLECRPILLP